MIGWKPWACLTFAFGLAAALATVLGGAASEKPGLPPTLGGE